MRDILTVLVNEKKNRIKGGIYNKLQVDMCYNSNLIEGSRLSHDMTRYIYETKTVGTEPALVNDIIEASGHFRACDMMIDRVSEPLSDEMIKDIHRTLKSGIITDDEEVLIGEYKKYPDTVGDISTTSPENVEKEINELIDRYESKTDHDIYDIIDFHACFEKIHPFYDGNGRIGRLLMFKECLKYDIVPFFIEDTYKGYYYRGLNEWQTGGEKGFLIDTCLMMQDMMKEVLDYFRIDYQEGFGEIR